MVDKKKITHPFGLEKWQRVAEPNWAGYANDCDEIIATFFRKNLAVRINKRSGAATVIANGLYRPHGVIPSNDMYLITDTGNGRVLFLDCDFSHRVTYDFSLFPLTGSYVSPFEWLQFTSPVGTGQLLASVDSRRSVLYIWDPEEMIYERYPYPHNWAIQSVLPRRGNSFIPRN